ncbi:phosphatidic acid phosphatase type 2/haloperoxidase [Paraphoma chrysanthemicola]|nr:phosphatidic acid phosphatase type 2/haloperoxidase [Paraphoma chrysanthemicola]
MSTPSILPQSPIPFSPRLTRPSPLSPLTHLQLDGVAPDLEAARPTDPKAILPPRRRHPLSPGFTNSPPFTIFLRNNWSDILTQLLCLAAAELLYEFCPPVMPRYFPLYPGVETSAWGMKHSKPYLSEYVSTLVSAIVSFAVPAACMGAVALWGTRRFEEGNVALIGLGYALATSTLFNSFIKIFIGSLRPHFLSICALTNPPPFPGAGPQHMYQVCTGPTKKIKEAQMSFPSGHASAAFAGFSFLALWVNAKWKVLSDGGHFRDHHGDQGAHETGGVWRQRVHHWKLVLFVTPLCIAFLIAGSKVRDEWHHPSDVVFGALVGIVFAHWAYKMVYRSVYDWRTNHIPMAEAREEQDMTE